MLRDGYSSILDIDEKIGIITRKPHAFQLKDYLRTSKLAYTFYTDMILTLYTSAQTVPDIRIRSDCSLHRNNIGRARPLVTSKQISVQFGSSFVSRFYFRLSVSMKNHDSCSCISDIAKQILSLFIPRSRKTSWNQCKEMR